MLDAPEYQPVEASAAPPSPLFISSHEFGPFFFPHHYSAYAVFSKTHDQKSVLRELLVFCCGTLRQESSQWLAALAVTEELILVELHILVLVATRLHMKCFSQVKRLEDLPFQPQIHRALRQLSPILHDASACSPSVSSFIVYLLNLIGDQAPHGPSSFPRTSP